jgi:hypothetical protein
MASDTLAQTVIDLDRYLVDPTFNTTYNGEIRERLLRLRDEADDLRSVLDTPPAVIPEPDECPHRTDSTSGEWVDRMMSPATAHEIATPYFSRSDLCRRRWTTGLIGKLLGGAPDWTSPNPHGAGFVPMQCWRQDRVFEAEHTPEFKLHRSRKSVLADSQQ